MQLIVHGRNVEITDWINEYVTKKVGKLDKFLPQILETRVELSHNATRAAEDRYTAQITMSANGHILRAEESTSDILASVDAAADKIARQIRRFKGRRYQTRRRASAAAAANAEAQMIASLAEEEMEEEELGRIVRRKEFALQPMDEDEAVAQMEMLGHDFFVYYDVNERNVNVVYRRRDGQYGLLQPRIG